jgi:hypothetical protein
MAAFYPLRLCGATKEASGTAKYLTKSMKTRQKQAK